MRLLFLSPYYPPEVGAPQTRIHELAMRLVARGHEVQVLTGLPNYPSGVVPPAYRDKAETWEIIDGVEVYRTWIYATPNRGFLRRILNHLSFMVMAILAAPRMGPVDVVYVESPPLFDGLAGFVLARSKQARIFLNVADLWPDSAVELGMVKSRILIGIARLIEKSCYRSADRILAVTLGIARTLKERGWDKAVYFPNGVETARFERGNGWVFKRDHGLGGKFVVMYAGTHGISQALGNALDAARLLESDARIRFVFVGDGAEKADLQRRAGPNVLFLDSLSRDAMPGVLAAADAILVSLKDLPLFRGAVPSKTYEGMAAGKPIVMVAKDEAPELILRADAGIVVPPGEPEPLAEAIRVLADDPRECGRMGDNGRRFVREHFDRDRLADRFEALLKEVKLS